MVATKAPSMTCPPSSTWMALTVPATGASTGISIFMDSKIISSCPAATTWPTSTRICHTLAVISASTSAMLGP